ncbi:hypothetical protein DFH29DRAFT_1072971 [Suillus ampliporus]|nr:hypothetical protein DFH29DRAFT_1072971 [Suillus ampliporus]
MLEKMKEAADLPGNLDGLAEEESEGDGKNLSPDSVLLLLHQRTRSLATARGPTITGAPRASESFAQFEFFPKYYTREPHCGIYKLLQSMMSSSTQDDIPQLDLGNTYGALFIGAILATMLFGVTNIQAFIYFQTHRGTGKTFYKLTVILLWILDALHFALIVYAIYYSLVTNYGNIAVLPVLVWSAKVQTPVDVLIIWGVHCLYVHRIWIVSKGRSRVLPITVGIIVVLGSGVPISLIWATFQCHLFADLIRIAWATYSTLGTICFLDVLIASSLCYLLATSRTGFSSTDSSITNLIGYTISTGCVTSVFSLTAIITVRFAVMPNNFVFLGVEFIMVKLYVNSYIALLNSRYYVQASAHNIGPSEFHHCHGVDNTELRICASQDENFLASRKSIFKQSDNEVLHITRPVQAAMRPIAVVMEIYYNAGTRGIGSLSCFLRFLKDLGVSTRAKGFMSKLPTYTACPIARKIWVTAQQAQFTCSSCSFESRSCGIVPAGNGQKTLILNCDIDGTAWLGQPVRIAASSKAIDQKAEPNGDRYGLTSVYNHTNQS